MSRQRSPHGLSALRSALCCLWRRISNRCLRLRGLQLVQRQLQLLDLPLLLFRPPPELHPPQLGDQQLQAFDLGLAPGQLFVFRLKLLTLSQNFFLLHREPSLLRDDESFQTVLVQRVEIRKGSARAHRACSMPYVS